MLTKPASSGHRKSAWFDPHAEQVPDEEPVIDELKGVWESTIKLVQAIKPAVAKVAASQSKPARSPEQEDSDVMYMNRDEVS